MPGFFRFSLYFHRISLYIIYAIIITRYLSIYRKYQMCVILIDMCQPKQLRFIANDSKDPSIFVIKSCQYFPFARYFIHVGKCASLYIF